MYTFSEIKQKSKKSGEIKKNQEKSKKSGEIKEIRRNQRNQEKSREIRQKSREIKEIENKKLEIKKSKDDIMIFLQKKIKRNAQNFYLYSLLISNLSF